MGQQYAIINKQEYRMYESSQQDSKQRPFICPCGKNYLSYPALFTHIKQKHNGNAPGQIIRPKSLNKRGRPRKAIGDLPNDLLPPLPDYKLTSNRLFFNRADPGSSLSGEHPPPSKPASRLNSDFIPPIPTSHLSIIKNYHSHSTPNSKPDLDRYEPLQELYIPPPLLQKLSNIFSPLSNDHHMNTSGLQALLNNNQSYQKTRGMARRYLRKLIGDNKLQMELVGAVFQFVQAAEDELSKRQLKNLQLLMSLLHFFCLEVITPPWPITTQNYLKHINTFTITLFQEVSQNQQLQTVFSLQKQVVMQLLEVFHQWLISQKLSQYDLQINPLYQLQDSKPPRPEASVESDKQEALKAEQQHD